MTTEVTVPILGESVSEASIGQWLKQPGDPVALDEAIASLETDKVAIEVTAPAAGTMGVQLAKEGDTVLVGAVIATIEAGGAASAPAPAPAPAIAPAAAPAPAAAASEATTLSPSVRRAVLEHGIDPASVKGTGKDGRITKEDVLTAAASKAAPAAAATAPASAPAPAPANAPAPAAPGERREERPGSGG